MAYTTVDLKLVWEPQLPFAVDGDIQYTELVLYETKAHANDTDYGTGIKVFFTYNLMPQQVTNAISGSFGALQIEFKLKRKLGRYILQTYVPTILIVMVSWLSFWMKPENMTERIMLGVTSLLTIFAQHAISLQSLPPVSYLKVSSCMKLPVLIIIFIIFFPSGYRCIHEYLHLLCISEHSGIRPHKQDHSVLRAAKQKSNEKDGKWHQ